jgi:hypothetical protein
MHKYSGRRIGSLKCLMNMLVSTRGAYNKFKKPAGQFIGNKRRLKKLMVDALIDWVTMSL